MPLPATCRLLLLQALLWINPFHQRNRQILYVKLGRKERETRKQTKIENISFLFWKRENEKMIKKKKKIQTSAKFPIYTF